MSPIAYRWRLVVGCASLWLVALPTPALAQGTTQDPEMLCIQRCPLVPDSFGTKKPDPACVKKCLLSGGSERAPELPKVPPVVPPGSANAATSGIKFTPAWETSETRKKQKLVIEDLVKSLPSGAPEHAKVIAAVKGWMLRNVTFHRTSVPSSPGIPVPEMRARQWQLEFDDRFFAVSPGRQKSLMMFELGKALWLDPAVRVDRIPEEVRLAGARINRLLLANHSVMLELKRTPYEGADLGDLSDGADAASPFGYAVRAVMLGLEPVDPAARATWTRIRPELERALATLVTR